MLKCMNLIIPFFSSDITNIKSYSADLCAELGTQSLAICESFGITDTMLSAPIALDWVGFNTYDNQVRIKMQGW